MEKEKEKDYIDEKKDIEIKEDEIIEILPDDNDGIKIHYTIDYKSALDCIKFVDKKKNMFKRIVYSVFLVGLAIYFFINYLTIESSNNNLFIVCILMSFFVIVWITPYLSIKKKARGFESITEGFNIVFFDEGFKIGTEKQNYIKYTNGISIQENNDMFIISLAYESIFPVKKDNISEEDVSKLREIFVRELGENYKIITKK